MEKVILLCRMKNKLTAERDPFYSLNFLCGALVLRGIYLNTSAFKRISQQFLRRITSYYGKSRREISKSLLNPGSLKILEIEES